jgi:hypothetical protein
MRDPTSKRFIISILLSWRSRTGEEPSAPLGRTLLSEDAAQFGHEDLVPGVGVELTRRQASRDSMSNGSQTRQKKLAGAGSQRGSAIFYSTPTSALARAGSYG